MFFTPIFLASIGIQAVFSGISGAIVVFTVVLAAAAMLSKAIGCGIGARLCKFTRRESLQIGTGMMTRGEITLVVAVKGIAHGLMDSRLFSSIIIMVLITVLVTPVILRLVYKDKEIAA
jgi:Kef-type K+ transport system membrane component KefB